ncbi:MAG: hypothetical protein R3E86_09815 [Pseudomonadales bacterium]
MPATRLGAFLVHLSISVGIFLVLAAILRFVWYPDFFFLADGGWQGMRLIAGVDLVLGPMLTLIVYDLRKPELKRDLAIIAVIQLSCLSAGTWVVYDQRPLALVYADGRFYSMTADSYVELGLAIPDFSAIPGRSPKRIEVALPADFAAQSEVRGTALQTGRPLAALTELYQPFDFASVAARDAADPDKLKAQEGAEPALAAWLQRHGGTVEDYAFFPFDSRYRYAYLGIDRRSGGIEGLLDAEPPR